MNKKKGDAFTRAELISAAPSLFGVSTEMMAGALHGVEQATREEAENLLKKFQTKEVTN